MREPRRRVLVTGSRDWQDEDKVWHELMLAYYDYGGAYRGTGDFTIVHGACPTGADKMSGAFADYHSFDVEEHPADWERYGKSAGFRRNAEMVNLGADVCLAFIRNGSRGASHTADLAEKAGIPVRRFAS